MTTPKNNRDDKFEIVIEKARRMARANGLAWFINHIFTFSFDRGTFVKGHYIDEVANRLSNNKWTMDISARDHFKSTRLYAEIMFDIFTTETDIECHYFSYQQGMSAYHLAKLKKMIQANPFFKGFTDLSPMALSAIYYHNGQATYHAIPEGLLSFKRGIHAERIYIDDPLKDPENKLAPTVIYKINNVIKTEMFAMVKKNGICRVVGTPQTNSDFFFDEQLQRKFSVSIKPAIVDEAKRIVIFPEWKSYEDLCEIRETIGEKAFNQEYMTKPSYSESSYIERKDLMNCVDTSLAQATKYEGNHDVVAGFDIGKKAHPAHLAIYERWTGTDGKYHYRQLLSKWFDHVEYKEQLDYLLWAIGNFKIDVLRYDNTRGEFEGFAEQGLLHRCMKPVSFNVKTNNAMAVSLNTVVREGRCALIDDIRQIDQLLQVNNDLQAIESPQGHGDSFWSNALALWEEKEREYRVRSL